MARRPEGPVVRWPNGIVGIGIARVRFTYKRRRYDESTGTRDAEEAHRIAHQIYADVVSGRVTRSATGILVHPTTRTLELWAKWLVAIKSELGKGTDRTYAIYARHWARAMPTIGDVTEANIGTMQRDRLSKVTKATWLKERAAGGGWLRWLKEQRFITEIPSFPPIGKKTLGTRHAMGRRAPDRVLSPAEAEACIAQHADPDFFLVCWLTGLRPDSTVSRLRRDDLLPGNKLRIRAECDKNGKARVIPVDQRAYAAMERSLPFGTKDRMEGWKTAVRRALGADRHATIYDLKHARITLWVDEGKPLGGISFRTGVSIEILTKRYAHESERAANWGDSGKTSERQEPPAQETPTLPQTRGSSHCDTASGISREKLSRPRPDRVKKGKRKSGSGRLPQNDATLPAVVRIALFERARGAA